MRIIVTGGAGFIGSALIRYLVGDLGRHVLNIDKLTYAANLQSLTPISKDSNYKFLRADICDADAINHAFAKFRPDAVMHLAAESHVVG
jgi:dTDP-glucose 4,6-dehydratase